MIGSCDHDGIDIPRSKDDLVVTFKSELFSLHISQFARRSLSLCGVDIAEGSNGNIVRVRQSLEQLSSTSTDANHRDMQVTVRGSVRAGTKRHYARSHAGARFEELASVA